MNALDSLDDFIRHQEAYRRLGCTDAIEINQKIAQEESFDIQMEYS